VCIKCNPELAHFGKFTYLLEFSEKLWNNLKEETKKILILHELKHILITTTKDGKDKFGIADHDLKDFNSIISKYGLNWLDQIKVTSASLYDFQNGETDKIKL